MNVFIFMTRSHYREKEVSMLVSKLIFTTGTLRRSLLMAIITYRTLKQFISIYNLPDRIVDAEPYQPHSIPPNLTHAITEA